MNLSLFIVIASLSGAATVRTFNATSGEIILEKKLYASERGTTIDHGQVGKDIIFSRSSADVYILTDGHVVSAINGETGEFKWRWTSPDQG